MIILANTCLATDIIYQYIHLINNYILIDIYHHSSLRSINLPWFFINFTV